MPARMHRPAGQVVDVEPLTPAAFAPFGTVIQHPDKTSFPTPLPFVKANQGSAIKYPDVSPVVSSYGLARSGQRAMPRITMFSCKPRQLQRNTKDQQVFDVGILERHPFTPQTFIPLALAENDRDTAYLVIVAPTLPLSQGQALQDEFRAPSPPTIWQRLIRSAQPDESSPSTPSSFSVIDSIAKTTATPKSSGRPDLSNLRAFIARGDQAVTYGAGTWHAPMVVLGKNKVDFVVVQYTNGVAAEDCQEVELVDGQLDVVIGDDLVAGLRVNRARL